MSQQRIPTVTLFLSFKALAVGEGEVHSLLFHQPSWMLIRRPEPCCSPLGLPTCANLGSSGFACSQCIRLCWCLQGITPNPGEPCSALLGNSPSVPLTTPWKEGCFT